MDLDRDEENGMAEQSMMEPTGIPSLPSEVVEQIFRPLSMTDRLSFARVNRLLQSIFTSSARLQYEFELQTNAYLDVPYDPPSLDDLSMHDTPPKPDLEVSSVSYGAPTMAHHSIDEETDHRPVRDPAMPMSAVEKVDSLKRLGANWETLNFASKRNITVEGPARVYEMQEGIFLMCQRPGDDDENDIVSPLHSIRLIPLPRHEDQWLEYPPIQLKSQTLPFPIADLTMDPTQDLIVVSEYIPSSPEGPTHKYHLLTLSTFMPHPSAHMPVLDFPPQGQLVWRTTQLLQVMGNVLVILVSRYIANWMLAGMPMALPNLAHAGNEEELVVWNWKTGNVQARLASPEDCSFSSLAILTPTTFMLTTTSSLRSRNPTIQIYSYDPEPVYTPMQPLILDYMDDSTPRPALVAQLEMPEFATGAAVSSFDIRPDPAFPPRKPGSEPRLGGSKPFTQDPEKGVVVFDLHATEPYEEEGQQMRIKVAYEMFVLRETLVEIAKEGEERLHQAKERAGNEGWRRSDVELTIPWSDWGRYGARLMDISMAERRWVCSCSGYRFMSLIPSDDSPEPLRWREEDDTPARFCDLRMYDFSPYGVRKEHNKLERRRPRKMRHSRSPMPFTNSPGPSRRRASSSHRAPEPDQERPWESVQDIATSTAPVQLSRQDVKALVSRVQARGRRGYAEPGPTELDDLTIAQFREQYDRLFWATTKNRTKSDRADRERGRGRAGGNRSESRSRSRSQSTHQIDGGSPIAERRSRSARSTSPEAIFRATRNPINMSGTRQAGEAITDEETEFEVRLVLAPTVLEKRKVWKDDVVSGLPFREVWRRLEQRANGVMVDDERVIVVRTETQRVTGSEASHTVQEMTVLCM